MHRIGKVKVKVMVLRLLISQLPRQGPDESSTGKRMLAFRAGRGCKSPSYSRLDALQVTVDGNGSLSSRAAGACVRPPVGACG